MQTLSSLTKKWIVAPRVSEAILKPFCESLRINPVFGNILISRGIDTYDKARSFFNPDLNDLHSGREMKDLDLAVSRLVKAIETGEHIRFYGDYDVDGTSSVAMSVNHFSEVIGHERLDFYIPDRHSEGYGVSEKGIRDAAAAGVNLLVVLDCGTKAHETLSLAGELGMEVIVCDHHEPDSEYPPVLALLNPKRPDCPYPFKALAACGVTLKLLIELNARLGIGNRGMDAAFQLAAIATCCDIVPMLGENRVITYWGLKSLNESPLPGVRRMIEKSGNPYFTVEDVVFMIGPRINAAGRIGHGKGAVALLTAGVADESLTAWVNQIEEQNKERKALDKEITRAALECVQAAGLTQVVAGKGWHKGVVGIVASRLIEHHYRPTVVLTEIEGKLTGSARSIAGFDLYEAIHACKDLLLNFGGHTHAAGLTMLPENLEKFKERFEEEAKKQITEHDLVERLKIDGELRPGLITERFMGVLQRMEPFGPESMQPVFLSRELRVLPHTVKTLGENSLRFEVTDPMCPGTYFSCIGFKMANRMNEILSGSLVDIVYTPGYSVWNEKKIMQFVLKDLQVSCE